MYTQSPLRRLYPMGIDSLDLLLNPEHARRIARCGIAVMDSAVEAAVSQVTRRPREAAPSRKRRAG